MSHKPFGACQVDLEPVGRPGGEPITRRFEVLYLDDRVRVVQFLPEEEDREPSYFVFERLAEAIDMEEEEVSHHDYSPAGGCALSVGDLKELMEFRVSRGGGLQQRSLAAYDKLVTSRF